MFSFNRIFYLYKYFANISQLFRNYFIMKSDFKVFQWISIRIQNNKCFGLSFDRLNGLFLAQHTFSFTIKFLWIWIDLRLTLDWNEVKNAFKQMLTQIKAYCEPIVKPIWAFLFVSDNRCDSLEENILYFEN